MQADAAYDTAEVTIAGASQLASQQADGALSVAQAQALDAYGVAAAQAQQVLQIGADGQTGGLVEAANDLQESLDAADVAAQQAYASAEAIGDWSDYYSAADAYYTLANQTGPQTETAADNAAQATYASSLAAAAFQLALSQTQAAYGDGSSSGDASSWSGVVAQANATAAVSEAQAEQTQAVSLAGDEQTDADAYAAATYTWTVDYDASEAADESADDAAYAATTVPQAQAAVALWSAEDSGQASVITTADFSAAAPGLLDYLDARAGAMVAADPLSADNYLDSVDAENASDAALDATITAADQADEDADALADEAASLSDDATQEQQGAALADAMLAYVQADAPAVTTSLEEQAQAAGGYAIAQALAIENYPNGSYDSNYVAAMATATATQQTALQAAATDYALAELAARGPQETAIATADLAAANQTASNITTWQDTTDANDLAASLTIDQAAHDDALADAGNEVDYDESSAELYDEVAQGIAAATTAAGYASLVADYGPLIGGPLDPSAAPYANEGASLADAALAEIQSTDTAWLTQQTTTADADLSEENTDATAQAGLINSQAAADATLTVASAQADYNGTLASIAAGPGAAAGPSLPAAPAALTTASIGFAAPSLPAQPNPAPGVPDSWFETLIGTNIESNPAAFHGPSPVTVASDEPSINVQYGQVSEAVNLAAVETSIQAPITATNDYYYFNYAVTPATYAAPTGMTYEAIAPPNGTTGSYDGNAWNPSSGDVSEAWFASATSQVLADATTSHAGGWAGMSGATPAVDFGTSNTVVTTLEGNEQSFSASEICFASGTLIEHRDGQKPIETIRAGDEVYCKNENDPAGPAVLRRVLKTYQNPPAALLNVHIGDLVVRCTHNHPFWVEGRGWTPAAELRRGDLVLGRDDRLHEVTDLFDNGDVEPVFNFAVAEHHTYFVASANGAVSALVHNACDQNPSAHTFTVSGNYPWSFDKGYYVQTYFGGDNGEIALVTYTVYNSSGVLLGQINVLPSADPIANLAARDQAASLAVSKVESGTDFELIKIQATPPAVAAPPAPAAAAATTAQTYIAAATGGALADMFGLDNEQIGAGNGTDTHNNKFDAVKFDNFISAEIPNVAADVGELAIVGLSFAPGGGIAEMLAKAHNDPAYAASLTTSMVLATIVGDAIAAGKATELANKVRAFTTSKAGLSASQKVQEAARRLESELSRAVADEGSLAAATAERVGAPSKIAGAIEKHHQLPREFAKRFKDVGLDIEDYVIDMEKAAHRLNPNGIHTNSGGNWNRVWREWLTENPNAQAPEILEQLAKMRKQFGLE